MLDEVGIGVGDGVGDALGGDAGDDRAGTDSPSGAHYDDRRGRWRFRVFAPDASRVDLVVEGRPARTVIPMRRDGRHWVAETDDARAERYWYVVDGGPPLLDPFAEAVVRTAEGFVSVLPDRPWPWRPPRQRTGLRAAEPVIYEMHVRGFARTFAGVAERLDHLVDLGVDVIELMPLHPFDDADNYWGYMPLVWGAVHGPYARGADAAEELAGLIDACHEREIDVWLDVVFNHTAEEGYDGVTTSWRGLADRQAYLFDERGDYVNDSGCGNVVDTTEPEIREAILTALDRFADLGVDGFRFDLASLLNRNGSDLVGRIGDWAEARGVEVVAEAWDMGDYQLGPRFGDDRWRQWNDRFRDEVRGFVRGEPNLVATVAARIAGSPGLFPGEPWRTVNFVDAHDGLTIHDLTLVTSDRHRSWDCGPELRLQQIENLFTLLLLARGAPMFVMGDEMARTQHGHDNPYNIDSELTWLDWGRLDEWPDLYRYVRELIRLRHEHPPAEMTFHGAHGDLDTGADSHSLAWSSNGLYVIANAWWESIEFVVHEPGPWQLVLSSVPTALHGDRIHMPARSTAVLRRTGP